MKKLVIGILAHVDAGKTTLSEGLLFSAGALMRLGRVDKRDAFLDSYSLERERGITIFSKQARLSLGETEITLIDTPGHIDFSCEAERALSVQDYAILVISAQDGVQAHTKTLWHLLASKSIPTFIFVNKVDIGIKTRREYIKELREMLSERITDFSSGSELSENAAGVDEELMAEFFDTGTLSDASIADAIEERRLFPCFFGSALKMQGVAEFLSGIERYTKEKSYPERMFGAAVYKIARDESGRRLSYMKILGGKLRAKDLIKYKTKDGEPREEKVEEIRLYSGDKYKSRGEVSAGEVVAVLGLSGSFAGQGLGFAPTAEHTLAPVLDYKMILPAGVSVYELYLKLSQLTEEDPGLAISYNEQAKEIRVRLMGEIQLEVLRRMISERFGVEVSFGEEAILYRETVLEPVFGFGHFEPLRHYAEVHVLIEPQPRGSGITVVSAVSTDELARNWQRLAISNIEERRHRGVLIGAPLTDVKISLVSGRAHLKHTEGGDFRQASYRAVRQGLMKARSQLLEPSFDFRIELPTENLGRAMTDIENMHGVADAPEIVGNTAILTGRCPVSTMRKYPSELRAYTRGEGSITMSVGEYVPCHNADEVIAREGYDPALDERHTPNSVFCKAGAGYVVPWYEVEENMHLPNEERGESSDSLDENDGIPERAKAYKYRGTEAEDKELMRIFESTYGKIKPRHAAEQKVNAAPEPERREKPKKLPPQKDEIVFIDGYNFIFASAELRALAERDLSLARDALVRMMCDYAAVRKCRAVIVFDAYKRSGGEGSEETYGAVRAVFTKERETADAYIERQTHRLADKNRVRVVSSDLEEQRIILGSGGLRVSAKEFISELEQLSRDIREIIESL